MSEDFLLKEEKFKELRDRLLKSASDFYGKLGALLGKDTDIASRRALAQSNFELADLTGKVGRNEDALAAHGAVLAAREALAAEPAAGVLAKVDVGRSLIAVAGLLEATGKTDEALASYRRSESLLAGPAGADPSARAALAACRSQMGWLQDHGQVRRCAGGLQAGAGRPGGAGRRSRSLQRRPPRPGGHHQSHRRPAVEDGQARGGGGRVPQGAGDLRKLADDNPAVTDFRSDLAHSHTNLGVLLQNTGKPAEAEAEYRKALAIEQKLADDNPAVTDFRAAWRSATTTSAGCCRRRASRRRRRPSSARRWRSTRSWPTRTPPSRNSAATWVEPQQPRPRAVEDGQAVGGGGRVPQGDGALAETGRRQPRRHRLAANWR